MSETQAPPAAEPAPQLVTLRSLLSDTMIYGLVGVFDKALGFALIPITTDLLDTRQFGIMGLYASGVTILFLFFTMGLPTSFFRFYTETTDLLKRRSIFNTSVWLVVLYSAGISLLWLPLLPWFNTWYFDEPGVAMTVGMIGLTFLYAMKSLGESRLQADRLPWVYLGVCIFGTVVTRSLSIGLMFCFREWGFWGWLYGELIGHVLAVGLIYWVCRSVFRAELHWSTAKVLAPYGITMMPALLSHWVMVGIDKVMIDQLMDVGDAKAQVGLYSLGERIAGIMTFVNMAYILGWRRFAFANMHLDEGPRLIGRATTMIMLVSLYCCLGLMLLGDDLIHWLIRKEYADGASVIPPLTLAGMLWGLSDVFTVGLHKMKQTGMLSTVNALAALLNVAFNFVLIPQYGIVGSAWATAICQFLKIIATWYWSHRAFPIPYEYRRLGRLSLLITTFFFVGHLFGPDRLGWPLSTAVQAGVMVLVPFFLWGIGFFYPEEIALVAKGLAKINGMLRRPKAE